MLLLYARVSSTDQAKPDRVSISEQIARGRAVATMRGEGGKYTVAEYIDKGVSGSVPLYHRAAGKSMLARADTGDIIVASKLDRIFRSASDALSTIDRLKRKGIGLIICDIGVDPVADSPAANLFFGMLSLVAQFERERIHERITEGKAAKRSRGGAIGGLVPLGYKRIGHGRAATIVRCDKEQSHIRRARELFAAAERKPAQVSRLLATEGMVGRDGKPYGRMALRRMLSGRQYGEDLVRTNEQFGRGSTPPQIEAVATA